MRKLPKRPRTFGRTKVKPYPQKAQKIQSRRLNDRQIQFFEEISPGFAKWYRQSYDENGRHVGERIPGLFG